MLIRNDKQREKSVALLGEMQAEMKKLRKKLKAEGHTRKEVKELLDPMLCQYEDVQADIDQYDRWKSGDLTDFEAADLDQLGIFLIAARIAKGVTQRELAETLGVNESTVSRDERNDYHGITIQRAVKVLAALDVGVVMDIWPQRVLPPPAPGAVP